MGQQSMSVKVQGNRDHRAVGENKWYYQITLGTISPIVLTSGKKRYKTERRAKEAGRRAVRRFNREYENDLINWIIEPKRSL